MSCRRRRSSRRSTPGHKAMAEIIALQNGCAMRSASRSASSRPRRCSTRCARRWRRSWATASKAPLRSDKATREGSTERPAPRDDRPLRGDARSEAGGQGLRVPEKETVRRNILEHGGGPTGATRGDPPGHLRGALRPHGSALFTRGQTQILSVVTLGTEADAQQIDGIGLEEKRYIHHYNFPPYSVGETRPMRGPAAARSATALWPSGPCWQCCPTRPSSSYTVRIVSETMESNGSTSMGSTCGSALALMDAACRSRRRPPGVAMGLITSTSGDGARPLRHPGHRGRPRRHGLQGRGTEKGVTALQMDIKVRGITTQVMQDALGQAREGRMWIMGKMMEAISEPRTELSEFAPRMTKIQINPTESAM